METISDSKITLGPGSHSVDQPVRLYWRCVGHNPTRWTCGEVDRGNFTTIAAHITRRPDGQWHWRTVNPHGIGVEPSRETAMDAADNMLSNVVITDSYRRENE